MTLSRIVSFRVRSAPSSLRIAHSVQSAAASHQNCAASRGRKTAAPVANLRNESIRMVMTENKDAM